MAAVASVGIVVGRTDFGEADRIVRFLTAEQGKVSAVAKGVRLIKSRSGGHLELFGEVSLMLAEGRNLAVVTSARLLWYPHHLAGDYEGLELAFMMATMIDRLIHEGQPNQRAYTTLREALGALEASEHGRIVELWFKLQLLVALGISPELKQCLTCGRSDSASTYWLSIEKGGILDDTCRSAIDTPISQATIKLWRLMIATNLSTALSTLGAEPLAEASLTMCNDFYQFHLGRSFVPNYARL